MRRSSMVTLTVLPMLASAAVAAAEPAQQADPISPPGLTQPTEPELSPPGLTHDVYDLACDEDPNWELRKDCAPRGVGGITIFRGGFGHYFHLNHGGAHGGGSHARGSSGS